MATWDDVREAALGLPAVDERSGRDGLLRWRVRDRMIAWERPLRRADLDALGDSAPPGPVLGVRVSDLGAKEALIADDPGIYFTTPHFDGYPAILVQLDAIGRTELQELITEAWLDRAPARLVRDFLAG